MAGKTYNNELTLDEVSLGIERLLIAPAGTAWTVGRVDISSPPANFSDLGGVVDNSVMLRIRRSKFQIITGIPRAIKYEAITGMDGNFEAALHSKDYSKLLYALGNTDADTSSWDATPTSTHYVTQYFGTRFIEKYKVLGVTDFIDGTQIIHELYVCTPGDELTEQFSPEQEGRVPLNFTLQGTIIEIDSVPEHVLGGRHQFGPDGSGI